MAQGLNNSWGIRTELDPNRSVTRAALPQSVAASLHSTKSARDVLDMPDTEWEPLSRGGLISRDDVADYLRAYENYQTS